MWALTCETNNHDVVHGSCHVRSCMLFCEQLHAPLKECGAARYRYWEQMYGSFKIDKCSWPWIAVHWMRHELPGPARSKDANT